MVDAAIRSQPQLLPERTVAQHRTRPEQPLENVERPGGVAMVEALAHRGQCLRITQYGVYCTQTRQWRPAERNQ